MLSGKNVILGVSGSIAAYKAVYLTRLLCEAGVDVWPILTASGTRFVGPLTFSALSRHRAITDMWSASAAGEISHVELAHRADALVLAPATADLLARLAIGRADDPLGAVALATRAPWIVAPAMESGMWQNDATQQNVATLQARGAHFVMPASGELASGAQGIGRMAEPEVIMESVWSTLGPQDLAGRTIAVTAGPTREPFDPVRFISNPSTGKMGFALARIAQRRGAHVHLISGPTSLAVPPGVEHTAITTTEELLAACQAILPNADALIMAAAPGDFRPTERAAQKTPKPSGPTAFTVSLEPTPDILLSLRPRKTGQVVVGFAAETDQLTAKALAKLKRKELDLIVANDVSRPDAGFALDQNTVELIDPDGRCQKLPTQTKEQVAMAILDRVAALLPNPTRTERTVASA